MILDRPLGICPSHGSYKSVVDLLQQPGYDIITFSWA